MILGINGIRLTLARSGVARCIEAVVRLLGELHHPFREILVYSPSPLPQDVALPPIARNVVARARLPLALWEQFVLPLRHGAKGVLLCPSYVVPVLARSPTVVIHHGSYEGYPAAFPWWRRTKARLAYTASVWRASEVVTVSEHSRRDIARYYRFPERRIHVVPEGVDTRIFRKLEDRGSARAFRLRYLGYDVPFIAYVGKPVERRNLTALIRAFAALKRQGVPHKLVLIGTSLPGDSLYRAAMRQEGIVSDVVEIGYLGEQDMVFAYNAADALVYPSSYEGFGIPVLEAMACGTPVIATRTTAIPEFAEGAALLIPDGSEHSIKAGLEALLSNAQLRSRLAEEGPRRAASYDWRIIVRRYLDIIVPLAERWERVRKGR
ncbi:MAG TPA: glycosyltransferase family 1 protein [Gemmatimonadaceae bacterium]|nr:glycosyltransferase family 1 protein [Gemmatimonadaceae bacterium]